MFHVSTMLPYMPNNPQQVRASDHSKLRCEKLSNTSIKKNPLSPAASLSLAGNQSLCSHSFSSASCAFIVFVLRVLAFLSSLIGFFLCALSFFWWIGAGWGSVVQSFFYLKNLINVPVLHILLCACTMTCL